jgi:hypothetical protein
MSSSTVAGAFLLAVRDRVVLVAGLEGPAFARVVRVDVFEGGLVDEGLITGGPAEDGLFDVGFTWTPSSSRAAGRTPGGRPRRFGASVVLISVAGSTSMGTAADFSLVSFSGAFVGLDGPAVALDRVALACGFFFVGFGSFGALGSGSTFAAARLVVRVAVVGFGGGFAGVTGPSDRSLRREGSDGRGSAGAFRFGGIVGRMTRDSERRVRMVSCGK